MGDEGKAKNLKKIIKIFYTYVCQQILYMCFNMYSNAFRS